MKYILILVCFTLSFSTYASNLYNSDFIPGGIEQFQNHQQNQQRALKALKSKKHKLILRLQTINRHHSNISLVNIIYLQQISSPYAVTEVTAVVYMV